MGHRTGFYFQSARGRAMVRTRSMNRARACQRAIALVQEGRGDSAAMRILGAAAWGRSNDDLVIRLRDTMSYAVRRARQANRDWRRYRTTSRELGEID